MKMAEMQQQNKEIGEAVRALIGRVASVEKSVESYHAAMLREVKRVSKYVGSKEAPVLQPGRGCACVCVCGGRDAHKVHAGRQLLDESVHTDDTRADVFSSPSGLYSSSLPPRVAVSSMAVRESAVSAAGPGVQLLGCPSPRKRPEKTRRRSSPALQTHAAETGSAFGRVQQQRQQQPPPPPQQQRPASRAADGDVLPRHRNSMPSTDDRELAFRHGVSETSSSAQSVTAAPLHDISNCRASSPIENDTIRALVPCEQAQFTSGRGRRRSPKQGSPWAALPRSDSAHAHAHAHHASTATLESSHSTRDMYDAANHSPHNPLAHAGVDAKQDRLMSPISPALCNDVVLTTRGRAYDSMPMGHDSMPASKSAGTQHRRRSEEPRQARQDVVRHARGSQQRDGALYASMGHRGRGLEEERDRDSFVRSPTGRRGHNTSPGRDRS